MKTTTTLKLIIILLTLLGVGIESARAQCPTVTLAHQSFCDVQSPTISDLVATDNGNGIVWYSSADSTVPLNSVLPLNHGATYYADDNSGACGNRQSVYVSIYTAPTGPSFQTPCAESETEASIGTHLALIGNNVQWYNVPEGGTPLPLGTQITGNSIYYASQINPFTGCETSRKAVYVNEVVIIEPPQGDPVQYFCNDPNNAPTLADVVIIAPGVKWYSSMTSVVQLPLTTPLVDGTTYYVASVSEPCTSTTRLGVTVEFVDINNAGASSDINLCDVNLPPSGTLNLFDSLNGTPSTSGTWTGDLPTTDGHLGTLDLTMLDFGVVYTFTYTVSDSAVCPIATATVTVVIENTLNPGLSNSIILCPGDTAAVDLFGYLGGTPDTGGVWVPALASGTGVFNPALDAFGVYTYTFNNGCSLESTITVVEGIIRNPGDDGFTPPICPNSTDDINLIDYLGGTPDAGGIWVPALASGTGVFNPSLDAFGVYTYTFNDGCSDTATVTVVMEDAPDPGLSNSIILCPGDTAAVDLFGYLGGTPDTGGVWVPALASGTGVFNPALDAFGVYTYTFNNGCSLESTITVVEGIIRNPGEDRFTPPICPNSTDDINLFDYLGGTPDAGGIWIPALASGTGIFNPALDAFGVYTYTFNDGCSDTATVTVVMEDTPDPGLSNSIILCPGDTAAVDLFGYLGGTPDTGGVWVPALASGTGVFNPSLDAFGVYTYTFNNGCSLESTITVVEGIIRNPGDDGFTPPICPNSTDDINLIDYLGGTPDAGGIWVPALASGTGVFNPSLDAFGVYTYTFNDGCSDTATVTVVEDICVEDLVIPDGFSPNGDGINDYFEILNIRTLYPDYKIEIYNRYGNVLFKGDASKPDWDGTSSSALFGDDTVPVGVYFFIIKFNDGQREPLQGILYLSR